MPSFADQLRAFEAQAASRADAVVREVVLEVGRRVIERSPRLTGRFSSNWRYGLQTPDAFTTQATAEQFLHNTDELPKAAAGFVHYVSNHLPYGPVLERGSSAQAPQGVVGLTALEFPQILAGAVRKVAVTGAVLSGGAQLQREGLL